MLSTPNLKEVSDADLAKQYKLLGDLTVLVELYNRHMPLVFGVCLKYLKDREESRDAVMQIFEKLVQSLREHEVAHFKSWLYVTARNYCLMQLRSNKNRKFQEQATKCVPPDGAAVLAWGRIWGALSNVTGWGIVGRIADAPGRRGSSPFDC